jgi:hypothetical protein
MDHDLLIVFERLPVRPSICSNATVIPGTLVVGGVFHDEMVDLDDICVLFQKVNGGVSDV